MSAKFHWRMLNGGETASETRAALSSSRSSALPDLAAQIAFARQAESCGIDGLLTDFSSSKPDPLILSTTIGTATSRLRMIVAYRSGLISPVSFVQQINTIAALTNGRVMLNIVAGHSPEEQRSYGDYLSHFDRYARTEEFLALCNRLWNTEAAVTFHGRFYQVHNARLSTPFIAPDRAGPEIFIAGGSTEARRVAISQGTCWMQLADVAEHMAPAIESVLDAGKTCGVRFSVVSRPTRKQAIEAARELVDSLNPELRERQRERDFIGRSDSVSMKTGWQLAETEWLTPTLWTGAVRTHGPAAIALVGSPVEIATAILEYREIGVEHFIVSGWPKLEQMLYFGREILPLVREMERRRAIGASA